MPDSTISPAGRTAFNATVHDTGQGRLAVRVLTGGLSFPGDEPLDMGGAGLGPGPYDLLCAALAACTTMTVRSYADQKGWPLTGIRVAVRHAKVPGQTPPDLFHRLIALEGSLDGAQRERLLQIAERCPVHRTLTAGSRITTEQEPAS